jgi:hypothetical protein
MQLAPQLADATRRKPEVPGGTLGALSCGEPLRELRDAPSTLELLQANDAEEDAS